VGHSIQIRKDWRKWCFQELGKDSIPEEKLEKIILSWAKEKKGALGPALTFEKKLPTESDIIQAVQAIIDFIDYELFFAIVGEFDAPVVVIIPKAKMQKLIIKAVKTNKPWNLSSISDNGNLLISPEIDSSDKELLISASGTFESIIEKVKAMIPDGIVFRGN
jgi:hypothetical protein